MDVNQYVFISYSRHDTAFVDKFSADLRKHGLQVWIDRESIAPGKQWQEQIELGLKGASVLIFVVSQNSLKSRWMTHELEAYSAEGKKIVPVIIEDIEATQLPAFIANIQWADFRRSYKEGLEKLLEALGVKLELRVTPIPPKTKQTKGYVFLSYAESDSDFVGSLKKFLKDHGYAYWDYEESDRDYHSHLYLELEGVIIEASATLSILSEAWKRSQWTIKEFFFSQEVNTPVFLLKAKELGPTLAIAGMTYIDFTKSLQAGYVKLNKELNRKKL